MRALAIVGLKLMGVSSLYRATGIISMIASVLAMLSNPHPGINPLWLIVQAVVIFVINVLFALVLLFRTERIVTWLRIPDEPLRSSIAASELLRVGLVIVGVIALIDAISESSSILFNATQIFHATHQMMNLGPAVKVLVEFVLGFVVIGKSRSIASRVFSGSF
ncbi:MAG: hypothetical protein ACFUZC_07295 [Chthoniobacteraceae bacterium]